MRRLLSSPLYVFFLLVHSQVFFSSPSSSLISRPRPQCHPDEISALLQLKSSLRPTAEAVCYREDKNGTYPIVLTSAWNKRTNCCRWDGITCDRVTGNVIGLDLSCSTLQGTIRSNSSLFLLRHLQMLDLSFNDFRGSPILPEFGLFKNMTDLYLFDSNFSGHVPLEISHLSKLVSLGLGEYPIYLFANKIMIGAATFKALAQNLTGLRDFFLSGIDMSLSPPVLSLKNFSSLTNLYLSYCKLRGKHDLDNIVQMPKLQELHLFKNEAPNGSFPESNWSIPLRTLYLSGNGFSIDLPLLLVQKSLSYLSLRDSNLVGSYPSLLGNLTQLVSLDLSFNHFSGKIPWSFLNLNQLRSLDLSYNNFTGPLPENISSYYSSNHLLGSVPSNLTVLSLSNNLLNGTIPSWLYSLPHLKDLDLSNNQFTGGINGEFQSTSLSVLSLGKNMMHGFIPRSVFQSLNLYTLDLSSNNFRGTLEIDKLLKSKELSSLDLSSNNLSVSFENSKNHSFENLWFVSLSSCNISEFPYFLRSSKRLMILDLSHNQILGSVPKWLWQVGKNSLYNLTLSHNLLTYMEPLPWNKLGYLDLRSNLFSGPLPIVSPILWFFSVSENQFVGEIPISLCNMSVLHVLDLSYNNLGGVIPQCMGNFSKKLSVLDLQMNKLHGSIPNTFAKGNSLRNLNLNGNYQEGPLPRSLVHCRKLEILDLGNNLLNDTFPDSLESLPKLQVLILRANMFHGSIGNPRTRTPFRQLRIMDLSNNEFNGTLPTKYFENFKAMTNVEKVNMTYMGEIFYQDSVMVTMKGIDIELVKIQTILTTIDFSRNNFTGQIPAFIEKLKSLKGLNFSHNMLSGTIPSSFGNLTNLEWLDLSCNKLVGEIPLQLTDLTWLSLLNLSQNQLAGPIPRGKQFNTFNNDSFLGNLDLCGFPLSKTCNKESEMQNSPTNLELENNSEDANGFTWKVVLFGYGCGLVFGILVGYVKFFSNRKASSLLKWL